VESKLRELHNSSREIKIRFARSVFFLHCACDYDWKH